MFSWLKDNRFIYIFCNLLVIPASVFPGIEFFSNISFIVSFFLLLNSNVLLLLALSIVLIIKNNSNYRFNLLLKRKGDEASKSDYECVYLYAWCTLLRYFLIGTAAKQIFLFFK